MKKHYLADYAFLTDVGKVRLVNEDQARIVARKNGITLMIIADGMGGHNQGDYASKLVADYLVEEFKNVRFSLITSITARSWLENTIRRANTLVYNTSESSDTYRGMGSTVVAVLVYRHKLIVINVGDSRAYLLKDNKLIKLSEDQSYVDYLKRSGQVSEEEANARKDKNVIMSAVGVYPSVMYNSRVYSYHNEPILLCSDGLFNKLTDEEIAMIINKNLSAAETVSELINLANEHGGSDNIGVSFFKRYKHD